MSRADTLRPRYRELTVSGSPHTMGRQLGEAARDEIRRFCELALPQVNKTMRVSRQQAQQLAADSIRWAHDYCPDMVDELRGIAEAAGVPLEDVMLLQVRNQLQPEGDAGCSSLSIAGTATADGHALVAQNWDNDPLLDTVTIVLTRRPLDQPAYLSVTQAGLIAYVGLSEAGFGACLNTLPAPARPRGVPHYFTLRGIFAARSLDEAVQAVRRAHRAIPADIMLATPQGPANLEVTIDDVHVLRSESAPYVVHTNHCLHPDLCAINERFPELIESRPRQCRLEWLLGSVQRPVSVADVQHFLADHDGYPRSICRHANDHPQHGFWETVFSVVMQPTAGQMFLARGTPCCHPFERYQLNS